MVSSTPWPHFSPVNDPVPILQEDGWAPEPFGTGGKSRPYRDSIPDRPARSSVAIPTELPGPQIWRVTYNILNNQSAYSRKRVVPQLGELDEGWHFLTLKLNVARNGIESLRNGQEGHPFYYTKHLSYLSTI